MILLYAQTLRSQDSYTQDELESQIGCSACFDEKIALEHQKNHLKVQVQTRGIIISESKATIDNMQLLLTRMTEQYYISEKNARKAKKKAFWRGISTGIIIGSGATVAIFLLN